MNSSMVDSEQGPGGNRQGHLGDRGGQIHLATGVGDDVERRDERGNGFARGGNQPLPIPECWREQGPVPTPALTVRGQDPVGDLGPEVAVGAGVFAVVGSVRPEHVLSVVGMVEQHVALAADRVAHDIAAATGQSQQQLRPVGASTGRWTWHVMRRTDIPSRLVAAQRLRSPRSITVASKWFGCRRRWRGGLGDFLENLRAALKPTFVASALVGASVAASCGHVELGIVHQVTKKGSRPALQETAKPTTRCPCQVANAQAQNQRQQKDRYNVIGRCPKSIVDVLSLDPRLRLWLTYFSPTAPRKARYAGRSPTLRQNRPRVCCTPPRSRHRRWRPRRVGSESEPRIHRRSVWDHAARRHPRTVFPTFAAEGIGPIPCDHGRLRAQGNRH